MVILAVLRSLSFPMLGSSVDMAIYIHGVFDRAHSIAGFAPAVKPQFAEVRNEMMYEIRSAKCEVSKATATAQDAHTCRMFNVKYLMFNVSVGQFLSPLVVRNNIGRGVSPCT